MKTFSIAMAALLFAASNAFAGDVTLKVSNMRCGGCAKRVKNTLNNTEAVSNVDVNIETKIVKVTFDDAKTNANALIETLKNAKFEVEKVEDEK